MSEIATTEQHAIVKMGFGSLESFEFMQRTAKMFSSSSMVPTAYQAVNTKGYGERAAQETNPSALANCVIALDMSQRMNANPLMIMQNLHIIEGRPSWSSQFIIAAINNSGKFSPLRFDLQWLEEIDATYTTFEWVNNKKTPQKHTVRIKNARCVAWALELATGQRLESAPVTMEMAVAEGWYGKNGSKWQSMPDLMLRYRSAAFFGRIYAPELLMGLPAAEEVRDVVEIEQQADGSYSVADSAPAPAAPAAPVSKSEVKAAAAKAQAAETNNIPADVQDVTPKHQDEPPKDLPARPAATAASKADPATGEIPAITANQVKYLQTKIKAIELPDSAVEAVLMRVGAVSLETLTAEQFDTMKAELLAMGA